MGGVFGVTTGIYHRWPDRCIDTPISESAIVGAAAGAALVGMRPVAEIMFADFIGVCMDQIVNQMAKFRYMFGGKSRCPGDSLRRGRLQRCRPAQSGHVPDHDLVSGSQGGGALQRLRCQGPMLSAIADDDPVLFFEPKILYQRLASP